MIRFEILKHALELLANVSEGTREESELTLVERLGDAYYALGDMAQSAATYARMEAIAERAELKAKLVTALVHQAAPMSFLDPDACIAICGRAAQVSVGDDHVLRARAELLASSWPGVLVFHENMGLTEHEKERATRLASLGYVALACDMFGERTTTPANDAERRAAFEEFRTQKLLPRVLAGLTALSAPTASRYAENGRDWVLPRRNGRAGIGSLWR